MDTALLTIAVPCVIWGLGAALIVVVVGEHHPIETTADLASRAAAVIRKTWSAR